MRIVIEGELEGSSLMARDPLDLAVDLIKEAKELK